MSLALSTIISSRYIITRHLASGGMADIYEANDTFYRRNVAIKVLKNSIYNHEFKKEICFTSAFNESGIVKIYNVGEYNSHLYLVYELINGKSFKEVLDERGKLSSQEAINVMLQVLNTTNIIHSRNIIHNDLKPDNLMLTCDGTIKIVDFGIAKHLKDKKNEKMLGSVKYLAPEVINNSNYSIQSDIYSLGIIFFELLTGKTPFMKENTKSEIKAHQKETIPSLSVYSPIKDYEKFDSIIKKATDLNLKKRYQNCEEFIHDLLKIKKGELLYETKGLKRLFRR